MALSSFSPFCQKRVDISVQYQLIAKASVATFIILSLNIKKSRSFQHKNGKLSESDFDRRVLYSSIFITVAYEFALILKLEQIE
jgi:hypothetical protein